MQAFKFPGRIYLYFILWTLQWLAVMQATFVIGNGLYIVDLTKQMADDNVVGIPFKFAPYMKAHPQKYHVSDALDMYLTNVRLTSEMLDSAQTLFMRGAYFIGAFLILWLLLHHFFPDGRELRKSRLLPGNPLTWRSIRSLKFW